MNAFDLLLKWPSWEKAGAGTVFDSPAWAMPVLWGNAHCVLRRSECRARDVLGVSIKLEDEENFIGIADSPLFPDIHALWDARKEMPEPLKLALVEKECGPLFQIIENAVRRQLTVQNVAPAEKREGTTGFEIVKDDGKLLISFVMKVTPDMVRAMGVPKFINTQHECIRSMTRKVKALYASFTMGDDELAGLAPGDFLMLPEIQSVPGKWLTEIPADTMVRIMGTEWIDVTFGDFADETLPAIPTPSILELVVNGTTRVRGRLDKLLGTPAFAIEEVL